MPISSAKITSGDYAGKGISSLLTDTPSADGIDAEALKNKFDELIKTVVEIKHNALIDALLAATSDGGSANIGATPIANVPGLTVYDQLIALKSQIDSLSAAGLTSGVVADIFLSNDNAGLKQRFAAHTLDFSVHVRYLGMTGGTSGVYTVEEGGIAFDQAEASLLIVRAHVDSSAGVKLAIGGVERTITTNAPAVLEAAQMKANGLYWLLWPPNGTALYILNPELRELAFADMASLQASLDGKAPAGHTHSSFPAMEISGSVSANDAQVVNVYFSSSPVLPTGMPDGTLFIQYME